MKKGFTLVELLAVIAILSLIALVVGIGVTKIVKKSKSDLSETQKQLVLDAAEIWATQELVKSQSQIPNTGCINVDISTLRSAKLINFSSTDYHVSICSEIINGVQKLSYSIENNTGG